MSYIFLLCSLFLFNYALQGMDIEKLASYCESLSQTRKLVGLNQSSCTQRRLFVTLLEAEIEARQQAINECMKFAQSAACDQSKNASNARGYFQSQIRAYALKITQLEKEKRDIVQAPARSREYPVTLISEKETDQLARMPEASCISFL